MFECITLGIPSLLVEVTMHDSVLYIAAKSAPACGALILSVRVLILSSSARENNGLALSE
jgi:hypothetical protein